MKIKVCGMKYPDNIKAVQNLKPDFMGFIFYKNSPRYMVNAMPSLIRFNENTKKVGVFVNSPVLEVMSFVNKFSLDFVQLHGNERVEYVRKLAGSKTKIIKAFRINEDFDWEIIHRYVPYVNYFLFDTATKKYGGSGLKFDWSLLNHYQEKTPFFLSGGITLEDIQEIKSLHISELFGIDVNSGFEIAPGIKNTELVKEIINKIRNESSISSK